MSYLTFFIGVNIESIAITPIGSPVFLFSSDGTYPLPFSIESSKESYRYNKRNT